MRIRKSLLAAVVCVVTLVLSGCSSSGSSSSTAFLAPYKVEVNIIPTKDINEYSDGSAHPVAIRIYQLKEAGPFNKSSFMSLYTKDRTVLEGSLIDETRVSPVLPGKNQKLELDVQQEARYLAVLAEFANYDKLTTKAIIGLVANPDEHPVYIKISSEKIEIDQPVSSSWWKIF